MKARAILALCVLSPLPAFAGFEFVRPQPAAPMPLTASPMPGYATPAPMPGASGNGVVSAGFDLPLYMAIPQIAPARLLVEYGPGTDPNVPVTWDGLGRPWPDVLTSTLSYKGLQYRQVAGKIVIERLAVAPQPVVAPTGPVPLTAAPITAAAPAAAPTYVDTAVRPEPLPVTSIASAPIAVEPAIPLEKIWEIKVGKRAPDLIAEWGKQEGWTVNTDLVSSCECRIAVGGTLTGPFEKILGEFMRPWSRQSPALRVRQTSNKYLEFYLVRDNMGGQPQ